MAKHAIFLDGLIGAGKTTLGRALAIELDGGFIDGDDHKLPGRPWYGSILSTSRSILGEAASLLVQRPVVVVAYPLTCSNWLYFSRRLGDAGIRPLFIGLRATAESILDVRRARAFSDDEVLRIRAMIAQGYGDRPFSDLVVDTDRAPFTAVLERLVAGARRLMASG